MILHRISIGFLKSTNRILISSQKLKLSTKVENQSKTIEVLGKEYERDDWTNINANIKEKLNRKLLLTKYHPLNHLLNKIKYYFYKTYTQSGSSPMFSIYDNFSPIVDVNQNFDRFEEIYWSQLSKINPYLFDSLDYASLLTPKNHVSRSKKDCFYVNKDYVLRSHTTCHDSELIRSGLNAFLTFGDVYRRDEIDSKHYPVFHQCDGVRLYNRFDLFESTNSNGAILSNQTGSVHPHDRQIEYTLEASKKIEAELKSCLTGLAEFIFGGCIMLFSFHYF